MRGAVFACRVRATSERGRASVVEPIYGTTRVARLRGRVGHIQTAIGEHVFAPAALRQLRAIAAADKIGTVGRYARLLAELPFPTMLSNGTLVGPRHTDGPIAPTTRALIGALIARSAISTARVYTTVLAPKRTMGRFIRYPIAALRFYAPPTTVSSSRIDTFVAFRVHLALVQARRITPIVCRTAGVRCGTRFAASHALGRCVTPPARAVFSASGAIGRLGACQLLALRGRSGPIGRATISLGRTGGISVQTRRSFAAPTAPPIVSRASRTVVQRTAVQRTTGGVVAPISVALYVWI